jgi:hypothetical protein
MPSVMLRSETSVNVVFTPRICVWTELASAAGLGRGTEGPGHPRSQPQSQ